MNAPYMQRLEWTQERVELVTKRWNEGVSCSLIAEELGIGTTRNAVIGKIHRLGLTGRKNSILYSGATQQRRRRKPHPRPPLGQGGASSKKPTTYRRVWSGRHGVEPTTTGREATELPPDIAITNPVTLLEMQDHHCRFPVERPGEPMMYCGAAKCGEFHSSYCAAHHEIAFAGRHGRLYPGRRIAIGAYQEAQNFLTDGQA